MTPDSEGLRLSSRGRLALPGHRLPPALTGLVSPGSVCSTLPGSTPRRLCCRLSLCPQGLLSGLPAPHPCLSFHLFFLSRVSSHEGLIRLVLASCIFLVCDVTALSPLNVLIQPYPSWNTISCTHGRVRFCLQWLL